MVGAYRLQAIGGVPWVVHEASAIESWRWRGAG
jgi:hypothetical protein